METETIPEPARTPLTTTDGLEKLFWKSWNPKKPIATITFVHGQSEHCSRYDKIFERFAKARIQVVCFDLRGHGHSSGIRGHTPFDKTFEDIDLIFTKSTPDVPHFMFGHSMGGLLTTCWVLSRQKLGKLPPLAGVIISGPLYALTNPVPGLGYVASFFSAITPTTTLSNGVKPQFTSRDVEQVKLYAKDPLNHGKISFKCAKDCFDFGNLCLQNANKFSTPVLFAHGGGDQITDPKATERFFNACTSSDKTLKIYPGWYHELHFELPEAAQEVLLTYENWIVDRILSKKHLEKDGSQQNLKQESKEEKSAENVEQKQEQVNVQTEVSNVEKKEDEKEVKEVESVETKQEGN